MTKFVLVGGYAYKGADSGREFVREFLRGIPGTPKVLLCYFARPEDTWAKKFAEDKEFYAGAELTVANKESFVDQLRSADALYIAGGSGEKLLQSLFGNQAWQGALEGKVVAGSSAGADIFAKYYYNLDNPGIEEGLGVLPIKMLVHYRSNYNAPNIDWEKAEAELKAHGEDLPLVTLREGEFRVFEQ